MILVILAILKIFRIFRIFLGFSGFSGYLEVLGFLRFSGFGRIWKDLEGFGRIWKDLEGFGRILRARIPGIPDCFVFVIISQMGRCQEPRGSLARQDRPSLPGIQGGLITHPHYPTTVHYHSIIQDDP